MQRPSRRSLVIANRIGIVVGAVLIAIGIARLLLLPVECSGQPMLPGQTCTDLEKGRVVTRTYDQQRSLHDTTDGFFIVGGVVAAAGSAFQLRRVTRSAAR